HANEMWLCCTDAVTSVFEVRMAAPQAVQDLESDVARLDKAYATLSDLVKDDPDKQWHVDRIMAGTRDLIELSKKFGQAKSQPGASQMSLLVGSAENFHKLRWGFVLLNNHIKAFRDPLLKQTVELRAHVEHVQDTISRFTALSIAGSVVLAAGL